VTGAWAQQQKSGLAKQDQNAAENETRRVSESVGGVQNRAADGEARTPGQTIGQIAHAQGTAPPDERQSEPDAPCNTRRDDDPANTRLEPEKRGAIGGP
jgi:hypothetical protein